MLPNSKVSVEPGAIWQIERDFYKEIRYRWLIWPNT